MSKTNKHPTQQSNREKLRILVVDDSPVARAVLRSILESDERIEVIGLARNGWEAVQLTAQLEPDVITMDVRMPRMDGYEATRQIMAYNPTPILIVTASLAKQDVDFSFRMLEAGALDILEKPAGDEPQALRSRAQDLIERVLLLSRVRVITHLRGRRKRPSPPGPPPPLPTIEVVPAPIPAEAPERIVVIGASTGGPRAIQKILKGFPRDFAAPILIVQHMATGFMQGLVEWLSGEIPLRIAIARHGEGLEAGRVYVAPEGRQMTVNHRTVQLSNTPRTNPVPSIDVTMHAAAQFFGRRAVGVLLTGMGDDGAQGLLTIHKAGGITITQDEASSTIFGMPRVAIQLGAAQKVLPLKEIAAAIRSAVHIQEKVPL